MKNILEIACFNVESALIAAKAGAQRIEFCTDFSTGGLTPSLEDTKKILSVVNIPVFIMIRPRSGNYVFTDTEFLHFNEWIPKFKAIGVHGFVFGLLNDDCTINTEKSKELVQLALPLPCTFHRAFDTGPDLSKSLEDVIACGFKRLLTSGGAGNAIDNVPSLIALAKQAGDRLIILPGGGVRSSNIETLKSISTHEFHTSAITKGGEIADADEIKKTFELLK
ncbi:MAG TPA: copper homeostasis protein CutC [Flavobacteriales bacterium]|nr:copper homeostasis protein CutC [Flavobacteriales bacterium]